MAESEQSVYLSGRETGHEQFRCSHETDKQRKFAGKPRIAEALFKNDPVNDQISAMLGSNIAFGKKQDSFRTAFVRLCDY